MTHTGHILAALPYLLLACPLHLFMHGGHGHHHGKREDRCQARPPAAGRSPIGRRRGRPRHRSGYWPPTTLSVLSAFRSCSLVRPSTLGACSTSIVWSNKLTFLMSGGNRWPTELLGPPALLAIGSAGRLSGIV